MVIMHTVATLHLDISQLLVPVCLIGAAVSSYTIRTVNVFVFINFHSLCFGSQYFQVTLLTYISLFLYLMHDFLSLFAHVAQCFTYNFNAYLSTFINILTF